MTQTIYDKYLEDEILNADPIRLVLILYRAAMEAVAGARQHLREGRIRERSCSITRAWEILSELMRSLDHSAGGDLSRNLANLYAYMQTRLIEANAKQTDAPLAEVESLLATLQEGWLEAGRAALRTAPEPAAGYAPAGQRY